MSGKNSSNGSGGGVTIVGLLGVVFVTLKLLHKIDWSWWWVTAPFWAGLALVILILIIALFVAVVRRAVVGKPKARRYR